jgi:FlaA1/EpsC-like NDP-sugar epimerase
LTLFGYSTHRWRKAAFAAALDLVIVVLAYYLILAFRFQGSIPGSMHFGSLNLAIFLSAAIVLHICLNAVFHVYSIVNRYVGLHQATWIAKAGMLSICVLLLLDLVWPTGQGRLVPLSVVLVGGSAASAAMIALRFYGRVFQALSLSPVTSARRVLIVGAGEAADMLVRQIDHTPALGIKIAGLVDDDPRLHGMRIQSYRVLGEVGDAPRLARENGATEFFIAIPSIDSQQLERIYRLLKPADLPIKTLPPLSELIEGQATVGDVRELQVEDLLGRQPVEIDLAAIAGYLKGRRVLVTGGAGSIGSELCRQIAGFQPECLIAVDRNESGLYDLHEELRARGFGDHVLCATHIQQRLKMRAVFAEHRPHVVFHSAAFKHVPLMESAPDEAVLNNVGGTLVVAEEAARAGVERFVNISTDKAADPISAMGASKALAEVVLRDLSRRYPDTQFCSVRFGNVLGSRGSVVPIFQRPIAIGGPVTVTHPEMTRYFMSVAEAVQLVLQAASMAGDSSYQCGVFILSMGEPVKILDVARKMISFSGSGKASSVEIVFTGLRPGERMHEMLVGSQERSVPTDHPLVAVLQPAPESPGDSGPGHDDFRTRLELLLALGDTHADRGVIIESLRSFLPTYQPFSLVDGAGGPFVGGRRRAPQGEEAAGAEEAAGPAAQGAVG